jgi:hypothetical protein
MLKWKVYKKIHIETDMTGGAAVSTQPNARMTGAIDGGSSGGSPPPWPPPKLSVLKIAEVLLFVAVLLLPVALVVVLVVVVCARANKARRNREDRRRLKKRVDWLRHLLPLLHPASEENDDKESGGGAAATAQAVRTVLARRLDATLAEADRLATRSPSGMCCGLARCDALARRLERAAAAVDEVYVEVLPVVCQIDATQSVVQMLEALQHRVTTILQNYSCMHTLIVNGRKTGITIIKTSQWYYATPLDAK